MLWFDNHLLTKGEAYSNRESTLYPQEDSQLPSSWNVFASPYKQWVSDSSISSATIPTEFNGSGRNDDIVFDFENGRIIETGGQFNGDEVITGSFAVKDFSVYLSNDSEEELILENRFNLNSRYNQTPSGIDPYAPVVPAIFINSEQSRNIPFAFGGEDRTISQFKAVVIAEDDYQLDGVLSIFADSARLPITPIPFSGYPSTEYGDIKNGSYNYSTLSSQFSTSNPYFIEDVNTSKLSQRAKDAIPSPYKIGFIDFEVSVARFPRQ
jgi:hypothetical protein